MTDYQEQAMQAIAEQNPELSVRAVKYMSEEGVKDRLEQFKQDGRPPEQIVAEQEAHLAAVRRQQPQPTMSVVERMPGRTTQEIFERTKREARSFRTVVPPKSDGSGLIDMQRAKAVENNLKRGGIRSDSSAKKIIDIHRFGAGLPGASEGIFKLGITNALISALKRVSGKFPQAELVGLIVDEEADIGTELFPPSDDQRRHLFLRADERHWLWRLPDEDGSYDDVVYEVSPDRVVKHHAGESMELNQEELENLRAATEQYAQKVERLYATL